MTRAVVVINPLAGHGRHDNQVQSHAALARAVFGAHGIDADVRPTTGPGDARRFAADAVATGCPLVVAWGGDGTVNEIASALLHTEVAMAIVPAGSGNGLAADLNLPFDARAALEVAAAGRTRIIDAGRVNGCPFVNIAGIGIDAIVAARFAGRGLQRRGPLAYLQLGTSELLRYRARRYDLTIDGESSEHHALLVAIANGRQYGNRLLIAPGARLDDGLLELVVVGPLSLAAIAWRLPALVRGTLSPGAGVTMRAVRTLRVRAPGELPFHVDGEPHLATNEISVEVVPAALRVRTSS